MKTPKLVPLLAAWLTATVAAQTAGQPKPASSRDDQPVQLESFIVTGSNIRRIDAETALPVTIINADAIDARGIATMAELIETLTGTQSSPINEANNLAQQARGDAASIDLRGLGTGSSLVLINGRRMVPHPISMTESGTPALAPNVNNIPRSLVDRLEILRDGASAIYGADAAAGVANFIISRSHEGKTLKLRNAVTQHGGGAEYSAAYTEGFQSGKTHVSLALDYFHRDRLAMRDRYWSSQMDIRLNGRVPAPWNGQPVTLANGTVSRNNVFAQTVGQGPWTNQWQRGFIQSDYLTFNGSRPTGNAGISTSTTPPPNVATMTASGLFYIFPDSSAGGYRFKQTAPSKDIDSPENALYFNMNDYRSLLPETDRFNLAAFVDRPLDERVSFFGDVLFYSGHSLNPAEPTNFKKSDDRSVYVPAANPWNPFGERFYHPTGAPNTDGTPRLVGTPADVIANTGLSSPDFAARPIVVQSYAWRLLAGLRGKFADNWEWESAFMASQAQTEEVEDNMLRESSLRYALSRTDKSAFNPFGVTFKIKDGLITADQPYHNPARVMEGLYAQDVRTGRTSLYTWDAKVNGRLWRLFSGGEIGVAAGMEARYETYNNTRPPYVGLNPPGSGELFPFLREEDNDIVALSPSPDINADQSVLGAYAEVNLPFVTRANRKPLIEALDLTLAGRYERFSIFGQAIKPKASLVWNPFRWLKLRSSIAESFRAPNLVQTSVTTLRRQVSALDSYRFDVTGAQVDSNVLRTTNAQGNPDLGPEEARTWSAGFVLEVPKLRGFSLTFDYFHVSQKDAIRSFGVQPTLNRDELLLDLATQAALAAGTPVDQIDLGSGTDNYKGYNKVARKPVTDEDRAFYAAYNAVQPTNATKRAPVGAYETLYNDYINLAGNEIQGYELGLEWRSPRTRLGQFRLSGEATRYIVRKSQVEAGGIWTSSLEKLKNAEWRANASASWRRGSWAAGWATSYTGEVVDTGATTTEAVYTALGQPKSIRKFYDNGITRYYFRVEPYIQHNSWVSYRFEGEAHPWLQGLSVRGAVNNVFDTDPPLAATGRVGYLIGMANPRGRQFAFEISRNF